MPDPDITQNIPPQAPDIEMAVLGAMLTDGEAIDAVQSILAPTHFYRDPHRKIFSAILSVHNRNEAADIITVGEELKKAGHLQAVGGRVYLVECCGLVTSAANIHHHANIVLEKAILRDIKAAGDEMARSAMEGRTEALEILRSAEAKLSGLTVQTRRSDIIRLQDIQVETFDAIDQWQKAGSPVTGISTGFRELDNLTSGLQPSDLILLAGRPSMGKTAFALNLADNAAGKGKHTALMFEMEMSRLQLSLRLLSMHTDINTMAMRGRLSPAQWQRVGENMAFYQNTSLLINDSSALTPAEVRGIARRAMREYGIHIIIIDYLQLMRGGGRFENKNIETGEISKSLKGLAKELNVPVIALSQLNRPPKLEKVRRPQLQDLRDSGSLEQDADIVVFVHQPDIQDMDKKEIIIAKQRNGPVAEIPFTFNRDSQRFHEDGESAEPYTHYLEKMEAHEEEF